MSSLGQDRGHTHAVAPSRDEVVRQLDRLLASEAFANAERGRRFLRYVVDRTLAGEGDQLKEFVIGVDVFDRGDEYDPRIDSIVRVEAGRLRNKLEQYYSCAGDEDPVRISVPRGSYVPEFGWRAVAVGVSERVEDAKIPPRRAFGSRLRGAAFGLLAASLIGGMLVWASGLGARETRPSIVVLPFQDFADPGAHQLAARVSDGLTSELARTGRVGVASRTSAVQLVGQGRTLKNIADLLGVDIVVEGSLIVEERRVQIDVRLVDAIQDRKGWVRSYAAETSELPALQKQIADDVSTAVLSRRRP
jgi:TolB-like protein